MTSAFGGQRSIQLSYGCRDVLMVARNIRRGFVNRKGRRGWGRRVPVDLRATRALCQTLPKEVEHWSLTTLREKLVKIGAKNRPSWPVRHVPTGRGCCAEGTVPENPEPDR